MKNKSTITKIILRWSKKNLRSFPWRKEKVGLYRLLASEIFLWKTQSSMVAPFFKNFFRKYPSPSKIEKTKLNQLKNDIKILGLHNRRSRMLKRAFSNFSIPKGKPNESTLRQHFGIGQYTARSLLSIFYNDFHLPVDENIRRLFRRIFNYEISNIRSISTRDEITFEIFRTNDTKRMIWALLDFSSMVCKASRPLCHKCCIKNLCQKYKSPTLLTDRRYSLSL